MIQCTSCKKTISPELINTGRLSTCDRCATKQISYIFPAAYKADAPIDKQEGLLMEDDASCFYHPGKKAVIPCSSCGRFLCPLCDIDMEGSHICFPCMESGKKTKSITKLENERTLFDSMAIRIALLPLIAWPFTCITAPIALFISVRYWNSTSSITPRTKIRFIFAILFSLLQIAGWGIGLYFLIKNTLG